MRDAPIAGANRIRRWSCVSCARSSRSRRRGPFRAAEETQIAQSAVSQAVGRLEAELGVRLLRRTSRGVQLTEAGAVVLPRARETVSAADAIRADLAALTGLQHGTVVLGTMLPPGPVDLPRLLVGFHAAHAGIVVRVREGSAREILALLQRDEVDVAVAGLPVERLPDGLAGQPMVDEELLLIVPPRHRFGRRPEIALAEPASEPFVGYRRGSALRDAIDDALGSAAVVPQIVYESDELTSVRELVARSLGISIVVAGRHDVGSVMKLLESSRLSAPSVVSEPLPSAAIVESRPPSGRSAIAAWLRTWLPSAATSMPRRAGSPG